jgi:hypothetical protein
MSEGGERKQKTKNHLTSPMSEGGENYLAFHCFDYEHT